MLPQSHWTLVPSIEFGTLIWIKTNRRALHDDNSMGLDDRKPVLEERLDVGDARGKRKDVASFSGFGRLCVFARDDLETHRCRE